MSERPFILFTDSTCDLPQEYLESKGIGMLNIHYTVDGENYAGYDSRMPPTVFYKRMREGSLPVTQQVNPSQAEEAFAAWLQKGYDVLCLSFSSALSGTYNSSRLAATELAQKYPEAKIIVIDSLCASMGEGLLVYRANALKEQGKSIDEVAAWAEENKKHLCHYFTVDDLHHLHLGGRVSKAAAVIGTALGIKPVLKVSDEGKLIPYEKIRGRKQALAKMVDVMQELTKGMKPEDNDIFFVSHGDCEQDAKDLCADIEKRLGFKNHMIHFIGPSVGTHSGPGTVALFFMGTRREL